MECRSEERWRLRFGAMSKQLWAVVEDAVRF